jgi:hypothetical protein
LVPQFVQGNIRPGFRLNEFRREKPLTIIGVSESIGSAAAKEAELVIFMTARGGFVWFHLHIWVSFAVEPGLGQSGKESGQMQGCRGNDGFMEMALTSLF